MSCGSGATTENKVLIADKLAYFLVTISEIINLGFAFQNKIYQQTFSSVNLSTIDSAFDKLNSLNQSTRNNLLTPTEQIEEYRQKFRANKIIDNLPPFIRGQALNEQIAQGKVSNANLDLMGAFSWSDTLQGTTIWGNMYNGKWDDATLKAFAPNLEDLFFPPPTFLNVMAQIEAYRKKFIENPIVDNLPPLIKGIAINEQVKQGNVRNEYITLYTDKRGGSFDWNATDFDELVWENISNGVWDDPTLIAFAPNMEDLLSPPPQDLSTPPQDLSTPPQDLSTPPQTEPLLTNQEERIFSDEELEKLIEDENLKLFFFENTKIRIANEIQSTNFQNLIFKLGGGWAGSLTQKLINLDKPYLFVEDRGMFNYGSADVKGSTESEDFFINDTNKEIFYFSVFLNLTFVPPKEVTAVQPSIQEEPKMPISKDIVKLKEEYEDVMFLIDVTPKVDIVTITELKQRAYDLKKEIDLLHLKRTDELMQSNNIFQKLFESSSVEPIFRYDLTPEPNGFAPDGTPTKLPKNIYDICQTSDFLDWFGNYKNAYNYRNSPYEVPCSIVRTEHYEPKVVFHGTGAEFSYFDFNKFPAMYFAENFSYAEWFAEQKGSQMGGHIGYVYPFLLNIKNYLDLTDFGINEISFEEFSDTIFLQTGLDSNELDINPALISSNKPVWAWVYLRNSPEFLKKLRDMKLFDGIIYYEQNPPINPTAPNYMTKGFIIFEPQNAKIVATNRKELLLPSMRSFYLKQGGKV